MSTPGRPSWPGSARHGSGVEPDEGILTGAPLGGLIDLKLVHVCPVAAREAVMPLLKRSLLAAGPPVVLTTGGVLTAIAAPGEETAALPTAAVALGDSFISGEGGGNY